MIGSARRAASSASVGVHEVHRRRPHGAVQERHDVGGDLRAPVVLQEVGGAVVGLRPLGVRQQLLQPRRVLDREHLVLRRPDQLDRDAGQPRQLALDPGHVGPAAVALAQRDAARPGQRDGLALALVVDVVVAARLGLGHAAPARGRRPGVREHLLPLQEVGTDDRRVPGGPRPRGGVEAALVVGEEPGVHQRDRRHAIEPLQRRADALRAAPVLADDRHPGELQLVDQRDQVGDVVGERVGRVDARLVGIAGADAVGRDHPVAGLGQRQDEVAVEEAPGRVAVQQQHRAARPWVLRR